MIFVIIGEVLSHDNHVLQMLPPLFFPAFYYSSIIYMRPLSAWQLPLSETDL